MPRVSIVVPAYNSERYIREALESVRSQTYRDWEVIVADDCSHDRTADVADSFGAKVTVLRGRQNRGPSHARNAAIERAGGELLAFLDADDRLLPSFLEEQVLLFDARREREIGIVACDALIEGPTGLAPRTFAGQFPFPEPVTIEALLRENPIYITTLCPRAAVTEVGAFSEECFGSEDLDLWLRIVERGYTVAYNPKPLVVYRVAPGSISTGTKRMALSMQATLRRALQRRNLNRREARVARRMLRLHRAAEVIGRLADGRRSGDRPPVGLAVRSLPLLAAVAVEHPGRVRRGVAAVLGREDITDRMLS